MNRYETLVLGPTPVASLIAPVLGVGQDISTPCVRLNLFSSIRCPTHGDHLNYLRGQGKTWEQIIESAARPSGKDLGF